MRALAVVNPNATSVSARTRDVLLTALRSDLTLTVADTQHRDHAAALGRRARADGLDLVIAVGGDGTINELVNGMLADGPGDDVPDLGIIPGGSANVLARNLGVPVNPVEATGLLLDAVRGGRRHRLNVGRMNERFFTFACGFGLDADVVRAVEEARASGRQATPMLYARTAVRRYAHQIGNHRPRITAWAGPDGGPITDLGVAVISNCSPWTYFGERPLRPTPAADFTTGLDLFGLTHLGPVTTLLAMAQMTTRRGPRGRHVVVVHDRPRFELRSSWPLPVQVDGDYVGERDHIEIVSVSRALGLAY